MQARCKTDLGIVDRTPIIATNLPAWIVQEIHMRCLISVVIMRQTIDFRGTVQAFENNMHLDYVVIEQKIPRPDHVQIDKNGHPQLNTVLEISNQFCIAFSFCMHITLLAKKVVTARDDVYFL